jgi:hypothetical protein
MTDPGKLRVLLENAQRKNRGDLVLSCQVRLAELAGQSHDDVLDREFWSAVTAAEEFKTQENKRTTRLTRTRQKHARVGSRAVIEDLAASPKTTEGFRVLIEHGRPDLTFEGVVLRHHSKFGAAFISASRQKLTAHGVAVQIIEGWLNGQG